VTRRPSSILRAVTEPTVVRAAAPCSAQSSFWRPRLGVLVAGCVFGAVAACRGDGTGVGEGPPPTGRIVFVHETPDFNTGDLHAINADGSGEIALRSGPEYDQWPSWAPDGQRLAFSAGTTVYLMDADGANQRALPLDVEGFAPAWSPDGQHIAFLESGAASPAHPGGVWVVAADGSGARRLPTAHYGECVRTCYQPTTVRWWRDGDHVLYGVWAQGTGGTIHGGWYTTRLRDSVIEPLPADAAASAHPRARTAWTRDWAFAAMPGYDAIVVRTAAGAEVGRVAAPAPSFGSMPEVSWAPDGQWFAYGAYVITDAATGQGRYELWVARRDGSGRRRIALDAHTPAWQPSP